MSELTRHRDMSLLRRLAVLAGFLLIAALATVTEVPLAAHAGTAPPPPSGWTTVFSDDFAGPAGSPPSSANWFYDIGTNYGTGEIEQTTNSTSNVHLDGNGNLDLTAINNNGSWTSGRIETTRDDFQAPPGGQLMMTASIQQPNPGNDLGYGSLIGWGSGRRRSTRVPEFWKPYTLMTGGPGLDDPCEGVHRTGVGCCSRQPRRR